MEKIFNKNINLVFNECITVLKNKNYIIDTIDKNNFKIEVSTKVSLLSWGENIEIYFVSKNNNSTIVTVKSNSKAQIIDWGTNSKNEKIIMDELTTALK